MEKIIWSKIRDRQERRNFILSNFPEIKNAKSILDVGCSDNELKALLGNQVLGVDISGKPDIKVDLEKEQLGMFSNKQFEMVVCTEVLEHVDNLYQIFDELIRVSSRYIIISLPNCYMPVQLLKIIFTGKGSKFYGLPSEQPSDRHKWFFGIKEIDNFIESNAAKSNFKVVKKIYRLDIKPTYKNIVFYFLLKIFPLKTWSQDVFYLLSS